MLKLKSDPIGNFDGLLRLEWLETNGLGGWASSTVAGANTRRYHGLLVAALNPPVNRMVMLSKMDETVETGGRRFELGTNIFPGALDPEGYRYLEAFEKGFWPTFTYRTDALVLRKEVIALWGENTTLVRYTVLESDAPIHLVLRPFVAARDCHALVSANDHITSEAGWDNGIFSVQPYDGLPRLFIAAGDFTFQAQPDWYYRFEYPGEAIRGQDAREDLFSYGTFRRLMETGDQVVVMISIEDPGGRDAQVLLDREMRRRSSLIEPFQSQDDIFRTLVLAADQFIVQRGEALSSIIAGYHWFTDWGRDTMIAFNGLTLATGRFGEARKILEAYADSVSQGMLPNRFPDDGEAPEYNAVDATLWFFVAIHHYLDDTGDADFVHTRLLPVLGDIVDWFEKGTRHGIHVTEDGLLYSGEPGLQLTWMDVKIGDVVVTPRQGYAVDVNALWYNALRICARLLAEAGSGRDADAITKKADVVRERFIDRFWYAEGGYLYDVVDGDARDPRLRPNQLLALSLPFPLVDGQKAQRVFNTVSRHLFTPVGLRSLSPDDDAYHGMYAGDQWERDHAYHQGTVWAWLLGPYLDALMRVRPKTGRAHVKAILDGMMSHVHEAGIGSISEIFDGDYPHAPKGCIAQAWSVGEWLRAYREYLIDSA